VGEKNGSAGGIVYYSTIEASSLEFRIEEPLASLKLRSYFAFYQNSIGGRSRYQQHCLTNECSSAICLEVVFSKVLQKNNAQSDCIDATTVLVFHISCNKESARVIEACTFFQCQSGAGAHS